MRDSDTSALQALEDARAQSRTGMYLAERLFWRSSLARKSVSIAVLPWPRSSGLDATGAESSRAREGGARD